jgi:hypothetical protein
MVHQMAESFAPLLQVSLCSALRQRSSSIAARRCRVSQGARSPLDRQGPAFVNTTSMGIEERVQRASYDKIRKTLGEEHFPADKQLGIFGVYAARCAQRYRTGRVRVGSAALAPYLGCLDRLQMR